MRRMLLLIACLSCLAVSSLALAEEDITIVNDFGKTLHFEVTEKNSTLPVELLAS